MPTNEKPTSPIAVSVILPVYNVEAYICQCLDSLIAQTLKNIEIICVDDGSTDNTLQLLEQYRQQDARVQVYHQQNQFAGVARNNGMKHATGKYLLFLDSDDFFEKTMLEKTYLEAERVQAEVVLFGAKHYDNRTGAVQEAPWLFNRDALPAVTPFAAADTDGTVLCATTPAPWTKLFLAEYIHGLNLEYMPLKNSNDVFFTYVALCCARRISYVNESFVYYRVNTGTSLQNTKSKNPLCFLEAYNAVFHELNRRGIYNSVSKGFRSGTINGCVYNYNSVDPVTKRIIGRSFLSEPFTEMNLLSGSPEDCTDPDNFHTLNHVVGGFRWKDKIDSLNVREDAHRAVQGTEPALPKVSVIIPCYNIEDYIAECLDSICGQTLREIEIICVSDGGTDGTEGILMEYAKKDPRITVLTQRNGGLSFTRNQGVKVATADYLYFMDGDDLLEPDALEILYNKARANDLDIVYFDAASFYETEQLQLENSALDDYYIRKHDHSAVYSGKEMLCRMRSVDDYKEAAWQQFVSRQFFLDNDLWFINGIVHEDNAFSFKAILSAQKTSHVPRAFYLRRVRGNSITTTKVRFSHAYGQFVSYLDMLKTLQTFSLTEEEKFAASQVLRDVVGNIRKKYFEMSYEERQLIHTIDPIEQELFRALISDTETTAPDLSTSRSYRIGRMITFIPRMLRAVVHNLKENGLSYTLKRSGEKIKSLLNRNK